MMQNLFNKRTLQPDPPKFLNFQPQGASGWQHEPKRLPKGFLLGGPGAPKTVLRLKIEDLGGVCLQSLFLKRFCTIFGGVLDSENVDFAWEG